MAGPTTEVLNEDIKELKAEIRDIRDDIGVIKGDLHGLALDVATLKAEFNVFRWIFGLLLAVTVTGVGGMIWGAATMTADLKHLTSDMREFKDATATLTADLKHLTTDIRELKDAVAKIPVNPPVVSPQKPESKP